MFFYFQVSGKKTNIFTYEMVHNYSLYIFKFLGNVSIYSLTITHHMGRGPFQEMTEVCV